MSITYSELFQFCLVVIGIIGLIFQAKKVTAFSYQPRRLLLIDILCVVRIFQSHSPAGT